MRHWVSKNPNAYFKTVLACRFWHCVWRNSSVIGQKTRLVGDTGLLGGNCLEISLAAWALQNWNCKSLKSRASRRTEMRAETLNPNFSGTEGLTSRVYHCLEGLLEAYTQRCNWRSNPGRNWQLTELRYMEKLDWLPVYTYALKYFSSRQSWLRMFSIRFCIKWEVTVTDNRRTDRQTDWRTDDVRSQDRALHYSASRGKKNSRLVSDSASKFTKCP